MSTYEPGQTLTWGVRTFDAAGAPATPASLAVTVTRPDGTSAAGTVTTSSPGVHTVTFVSTQAGRYRAQVTGSGPNAGGLPWSDVADVWPADPRLIISLEDARGELDHISNVKDDELRLYIAAATPVVEEIAGRVLAATVVETHDGGKAAVLLDERPTAITSVVVDGTTLAASEYVAKLSSGIVYAGSSSSPTTFDYGRQNVVVTFTAGASTIDPNVIAAARVIVAHMYSVGQQGRRRSNTEEIILGSGFSVPRRAVELLRDRAAYRMPGMA